MAAGPGPGAPIARRGPELTPLARELVEQVLRQGPLPFDEVVDRALYDPELGFYGAGGGRAGTRGDFLTSPEVGPLFGAVVARALDGWWLELGRPDPFTVVEAAAGTGSLARSVLGAEPACAPALRYVLVERSDALRAHHRDHLELVVHGDAPSRPAGPGSGPWVWSRADLPPGPLTGVVVANELLDNLACSLVERGPDGWLEVHVGVTGARPEDDRGDPYLVEVLVPAAPERARWAGQIAPDAPVGARLPDQREARTWVADAVGRLARGWVVVLDYADTTAGMAGRPQEEWLRTYRGHGRGSDPLQDLGLQDITCEVALDQLISVAPPVEVVSQADFLARHGIAALVDEGRRVWAERAHIGDLAAIRARSRVGEAEALTDPGGLGGYQVLVWRRP